MLHDLGWQSLDGRRQDQRLALFYKIINGLASVETEDILTPADSRTRKNHSFKFKHLEANCDSYRYSFFPATISSWSNLPFGIEKVDSVQCSQKKCSIYKRNRNVHTHIVYNHLVYIQCAISGRSLISAVWYAHI